MSCKKSSSTTWKFFTIYFSCHSRAHVLLIQEAKPPFCRLLKKLLMHLTLVFSMFCIFHFLGNSLVITHVDTLADHADGDARSRWKNMSFMRLRIILFLHPISELFSKYLFVKKATKEFSNILFKIQLLFRQMLTVYQ